MSDEIEDALTDSQYIAGAKAGFAAAQSDDPNGTLKRVIASRDGYLKPLQASSPAAAPDEGLADRLQKLYDAVKCFPEQRPDGFSNLLELRNMIPEAIAVLRSRPQPAHWRPIGSAPKDGTWIIGKSEQDGSVYRISWGVNHRGAMAWCTSCGSFVGGYITHWTPDPAPPAEENGKNG